MRDNVADFGGIGARADTADHPGGSLARSVIRDLRDEAGSAWPPAPSATTFDSTAVFFDATTHKFDEAA